MNRSQFRRRWVAAAGTAVAALVLTGAPGPASAASARRGPESALPRTSIPWSKVGPGWYLVEADTSHIFGGSDGTESVFLTSPKGVRYEVAEWPGTATGLGRLTAWSGRTAHALLVRSILPGVDDRHDRVSVVDLDLRTGRHTAFTLPRSEVTGGMTYAPDGKSLLLSVPNPSDVDQPDVERFSPTGQLLGQVYSEPDMTGPFLSSPDGKTVVVGKFDGLTVVSATGRLLRNVGTAVGLESCVPIRWWSAGSVLAGCSSEIGSGSQLWAIPLSGAPARAVTPARWTGDSVLMDLDAWSVRGAIYTEAMFAPSATSACNPALAAQSLNGSPQLVRPRRPLTFVSQVVAQTGSRLAVLASGTCGSARNLVLLDPHTGATTVLVPSTPVTWGVQTALAFPVPGVGPGY